MAVAIDIIDGGTSSQHVVQGRKVTRIAKVYGLVAPLGGTQQDLLNAAVQQVQAITGPLGSQCPGEPNGSTYLEEFIPELLSTDVVQVRIVYKGYPQIQIEFNGSLSTVQANLDANGDPITVEYTYPSDYVLNERLRGQTIEQGVMVSRVIPEFTMSFKFTTVGSGPAGTGADYVLNFCLSYLGCVNFGVWGSAPGAARTWLCENVRAISRDGGTTYEWTVVFHYRDSNWDTLVAFINPDDGKPPSDLLYAVGYKYIQTYETANFPPMPP